MVLNYKGLWNSVKNSPQLADGIGTASDCYKIFHNPSLAAGNLIDQRDLGSGVKSWPTGEFMYYNGTTWDLVPEVAGLPPTGGAGGDLSGTYPNPTVTGIRGVAVPVLATGILKFNGTAWVMDNSAYILLTSLSGSSPITYNNTTGAIGIQVSNGVQSGYLNVVDWNTFNNKQATISLTTTGTSGAATFIGNVLNIPNYAGGGGTPGGTTGQVQYNNAGAFAGATKVTIDNADGREVHVSATAIPTPPSAGNVKVYSNNRTGFDELRASQGLGTDFGLQASFGQKSICMMVPLSNNTPSYLFGWAGVGTASPGTFATVVKSYDASNMAPNYHQLKCTTAAAINSAGELFINNVGRGILIGNTAYGSGGKLIMWFTLPTYLSTERFFFGYTAGGGALTLASNPSSILNCIGIAKDNTPDTTFQLMYNDGSGTCTKVDTTITPNQNDVYRMTIFIPPIGTSLYLTFEVIAKSGGSASITTFDSGALTSNIPAAGVTMVPHMAVNTVGVATAIAFALINMYEEQY